MKVSAREFAEFNGLLADVVERGLPLAPAVDLMAGAVSGSRLRTALRDLSKSLGEGASLPDALALTPEVFPPDYCASVRAGLEGGRLAPLLRAVQTQHQFVARLRGKLAKLLLYLLAGAGVAELGLGCVLVFGSRWVVSFKETFEPMGMTKFPEPIEALFQFFDLKWLPLLAIPGAFLLVAALYRFLQRSGGLGWLGYFLPVWGRIQKSRDLATFCSSLGSKLHSGAPLGEALRAGRDSVANRHFKRLTDKVMHRVSEGEALSSALYYVPFFPRTLTWAISLGEKNGELPRTFSTFTTLYATQMERGFEMLYQILTPLSILIVGYLVLFCSVMLLMPLFTVMSIQSNLSNK